MLELLLVWVYLFIFFFVLLKWEDGVIGEFLLVFWLGEFLLFFIVGVVFELDVLFDVFLLMLVLGCWDEVILGVYGGIMGVLEGELLFDWDVFIFFFWINWVFYRVSNIIIF